MTSDASNNMSLRKKFFVGIILLLLLFIVWPVVAHYRAKARLAAHKQKLIAQGEKLAYHELTPLGSSEPNKAREFDQASRRLQPDWLSSPSVAKEVAPGVARVVWKEVEPLESLDLHAAGKKGKTNLWPLLEKMIETNSLPLAEIKEALESSDLQVPLNQPEIP